MSYAKPSLMPPFARPSSRVAIAAQCRYDGGLADIIFRTVQQFALPVAGSQVLLKPNFVEPDPEGIINTHPAVVAAAREAFLRLGAKSVRIAEGPGHERDSEAMVETLRLREFFGPLRDVYVDLNLDEVRAVDLRTRASKLKQLYLPRTVLEADYIVSMPKLKTHHWAGVTLSLKNLFGVVPGIAYGWPKNVLHWKGIDRSILDINAAVPTHFVIADGITALEGNGPLHGSPRNLGRIVLADDPVAADFVCTRLMGLNPLRVNYLAQAAEFLGNGAPERILQLGEPMPPTVQPFAVLPEFAHLRL